MLDTIGFDGLDFDWEFTGGMEQTTNKYQTQTKSLRSRPTRYLDVLSLPVEKANLGIAFYARYFTTDPAYPYTKGLGCKTVLLEAADGSDTGKSAAMTFETAKYAAAPTNLAETTDGSCGASVGFNCKTRHCCSAYGYCGSISDYCGTNCLSEHGSCNSTSIGDLFKTATANGVTDEDAGGEYYYDSAIKLLWSSDTPEMTSRKFTEIVKTKGLGGVMAWSAGEDRRDWSHIHAMQKVVKRFCL